MTPPEPGREHADAAEALAVTALLVARWVERALGGLEPPLTPGQYEALRSIAAGRATVASLARRASTSASAASQLVSGLERAGWVARKPEPLDRRRERLELTPAGERVVTAASVLLRRCLSPLARPLRGPEAHALVRLLKRLEDQLGSTPPPPRPPRPPRPPGP